MVRSARRAGRGGPPPPRPPPPPPPPPYRPFPAARLSSRLFVNRQSRSPSTTSLYHYMTPVLWSNRLIYRWQNPPVPQAGNLAACSWLRFRRIQSELGPELAHALQCAL